jgi:hypothetical protein
MSRDQPQPRWRAIRIEVHLATRKIFPLKLVGSMVKSTSILRMLRYAFESGEASRVGAWNPGS